jgi:hypothetical protein
MAGNLFAEMPVKLAVDAPGPVLEPRPNVECAARLLDERNRPVTAPADLTVRISVQHDSQVAATQSQTIPAGAGAVTFPVSLPASGLVRLVATHRELFDGEAAFRVQPVPATGAVPRQLFLWYAPSGRRLLADGVDTVRFGAALDAPAPTEVRLQFRDQTGLKTVVIPAGQSGVQFAQTSQRAGPLAVQYVNALPPLECRDTTLMEVGFMRPLRRLQLEPVPATVPLGRTVALHVRLRDVYDQPCAAGEIRHVQLLPASGQAGFQPATVRFGPDADQATAEVYPLWPGTIRVQARSLRLNDAETTVQVSWEWAWIGAAAMGGLLGSLLAGWFARWRARFSERRHVGGGVLVTVGESVVGLASGVVVFLLGVVLALAGHAWLAHAVAPELVANGPGAGGVGLIGGWVAVKVLHHRREATD